MASQEMGYDLLWFTRLDTMAPNEVTDALLDGRVDGAVFLHPNFEASVIESVTEAGLPIAVVSRRMELDVPQFVCDNRTGAIAALEHLWNLGHRKIGHVSGPMAQFDARERYQTYVDFMIERGGTPYTADGDFEEETAKRVTLDLLRQHKLSAIFAASDETATGVLFAAQELGLDIPRDLSVVGFDDVPSARLQHPPLTSVSQPIDQMARDAVRTVAAMLNNRPTPHPKTYPTELVLRSSTSQPNGGHSL
jgi:DNA-binding LacI/PurR family transcriptional regulator